MSDSTKANLWVTYTALGRPQGMWATSVTTDGETIHINTGGAVVSMGDNEVVVNRIPRLVQDIADYFEAEGDGHYGSYGRPSW